MKRIKKQFWLTESEAADLKEKSMKTGLSQTAIIRILLKGYEPKEKPDDRFYDAMREMYAIGNNLNQIARKANSLGFIETKMLKQAIEHLQSFLTHMETKYLRPTESELKWK